MRACRSMISVRIGSVLKSDCNSADGIIPSTIRKAVSSITCNVQSPLYSIEFVTSLLKLLLAFANSNFRYTSSSSPRFAYSGIASSLLSLLSNSEDKNAPLVLLSVKIFYFLLESCQSVFQSFMDSNGLTIVLRRCKLESDFTLEWIKQYGNLEPSSIDNENDDKNNQQDSSNANQQPPVPQPQGRNSQKEESSKSVHHSLLKEFLNLLLTIFHSPWRSMDNGIVGRLIQESLPSILLPIFNNWKMYSAKIYSLALRVFSEFIQTEPSSYSMILETGLNEAVLDSIMNKNCPYDIALRSICNVLSSLCLNNIGIQEILKRNILHKLLSVLTMDTFTSPNNSEFSENAAMLGTDLNELVKHHPALKEAAIEACYLTIKRVLEICKERNADPNLPKSIKTKILYFRQNIASFLESFYAGGFNLGMNENQVQNWIDLMLELYTLPLCDSRPSPVIDNTCLLAFLSIATSHLHILLRSVFKLIAVQLSKITRESFEYNQSTLHTLCQIDCLISLLVGLAEPSDYQRPSALQELTTLDSIVVCKSMSEVHRILLWEVSKLNLELQYEQQNNLKNSANGNFSSSSSSLNDPSSQPSSGDNQREFGNPDRLDMRLPILRRGRVPILRRNYDNWVRFDDDELPSPRLANPFENNNNPQEQANAESTEAVPSSEASSSNENQGQQEQQANEESKKEEEIELQKQKLQKQQSESQIKRLVRDRISELIAFIHQLSVSLLRATTLLGDQQPLLKALAELLRDHFKYPGEVIEKERVEGKADKVYYGFVPILYLGGMLHGLNSLLTSDSENSSSGLLLRTFYSVGGIKNVISACTEYLMNESIIGVLNNKQLCCGSQSNIRSTYISYSSFLRQLISPSIKRQLIDLKMPPKKLKRILSDIYGIELKTFLPMWKHSEIHKLPNEFLSDLFILCDQLLDGVNTFTEDKEPKKAQVQPDEELVMRLVYMGFPQRGAREALRQNDNNIQTAADWLLSNAEIFLNPQNDNENQNDEDDDFYDEEEEIVDELPLPEEIKEEPIQVVEEVQEEEDDAIDEEDELAIALALSMGEDPSEILNKKKKKVEQVPAPTPVVKKAEVKRKRVRKEKIDVGGLYEELKVNLLDECIKLLPVEDIAQSLSQFLLKYARREEWKISGDIIESFAAQIISTSFTYEVTNSTTSPVLNESESEENKRNVEILFNSSYILTLMAIQSSIFRNEIENQQIASLLLDKLSNITENESNIKWVKTALLTIDSICRLSEDFSIKLIESHVESDENENNNEIKEEPAPSSESDAKEEKKEGEEKDEKEEKEKEEIAKEVEKELKKEEEEKKKKERLLKSKYAAITLLSEEQQEQALFICLKFLKFKTLNTETLHAILQLLSKLTKKSKISQLFLQENGVDCLFNLPKISTFPAGSNLILNVLRHLIEDQNTLQSSMEHEILFFLKQMPEKKLKSKAFAGLFSHLLHRDSDVFLKAASSCCQITSGKELRILPIPQQVQPSYSPPVPAPSSPLLSSSNSLAAYQSLEESGNLSTSQGLARSTGLKSSSKRLTGSRKSIISSNSLTKLKLARKPSEGLSKIIPLVAQTLIDLIELKLENKKEEKSEKKQEAGGEEKQEEKKEEAEEDDSKDSFKQYRNDLDNLMKLHESEKQGNKTGAAGKSSILTVSNLLSYLADFTSGYSATAPFLLRSSSGFEESLSISNFLEYLIKNVLSYSEKFLTDKQFHEPMEEFVVASKFFLALWGKPDSRKRILIEISNSLKEFIKEHADLPDQSSNTASEANEKEEEAERIVKKAASLSELCSIAAIADLLHILLSASNASQSATEQQSKSELCQLFLDSKTVEEFLFALDRIDLDRIEAPKVLSRILQAIEITTKIITSSFHQSQLKNQLKDNNKPGNTLNSSSNASQQSSGSGNEAQSAANNRQRRRSMSFSSNENDLLQQGNSLFDSNAQGNNQSGSNNVDDGYSTPEEPMMEPYLSSPRGGDLEEADYRYNGLPSNYLNYRGVLEAMDDSVEEEEDDEEDEEEDEEENEDEEDTEEEGRDSEYPMGVRLPNGEGLAALIGDNDGMDEDNRLSSLLTREISDLDEIIPFINSSINPNMATPSFRLFAREIREGGRSPLAALTLPRSRNANNADIQHPLLLQPQGQRSGRYPGELNSLFDFSARYPLNQASPFNALQILQRNLDITLAPGLLQRYARWLEGGTVTNSMIEFSFLFEEVITELLLTESARIELEKIKEEERVKLIEERQKKKEEKQESQQGQGQNEGGNQEGSSPQLSGSNNNNPANLLDPNLISMFINSLSNSVLGSVVGNNNNPSPVPALVIPDSPVGESIPEPSQSPVDIEPKITVIDSPPAECKAEPLVEISPVPEDNKAETAEESNHKEEEKKETTEEVEKKEEKAEGEEGEKKEGREEAVATVPVEGGEEKKEKEEGKEEEVVVEGGEEEKKEGGEEGVATVPVEGEEKKEEEEALAAAIEAGMENLGIDMEILNELPDHIRNEILANTAAMEAAIRNVGAGGNAPEVQNAVIGEAGIESRAAEEMDINTFLATLTDELREDILATMEEGMINTLNPQYVAEANRLRERAMGGGIGGFIRRPQVREQFNFPGNDFYSEVRRSRYGGVNNNQGSGLDYNPSFINQLNEFNRQNYNDYEGPSLISEKSLVSLLRILYLNELTANVLPRLFQNFSCNPKTRSQLLTMLIYLLSYSNSSLLLENETELDKITSSLDFSPIRSPCHPLIGFKEGPVHYSYSTCGQYPPNTVLRRILTILEILAKKIPKVFDYMFSPVDIPIESLASKNYDLSILPINKLFELLCKPQIADSSQTLELLIQLISTITEPLIPFTINRKALNNDQSVPDIPIVGAIPPAAAVAPLPEIEEVPLPVARVNTPPLSIENDEIVQPVVESLSEDAQSQSQEPANSQPLAAEAEEQVNNVPAAPAAPAVSNEAGGRLLSSLRLSLNNILRSPSSSQILERNSRLNLDNSESDSEESEDSIEIEEEEIERERNNIRIIRRGVARMGGAGGGQVGQVGNNRIEKSKIVCPELPSEYLKNLPKILTKEICSEKTYKNTMIILQRVCANESNRNHLLSELQCTAISLSTIITKYLQETITTSFSLNFNENQASILTKEDEKQSTAVKTSKILTWFSSKSSIQGISLLRLLKLMIGLDGSSLESVNNQYKTLWDTLDECLTKLTELISSDDEIVSNIDSFSHLFLLPIIECYFVVHMEALKQHWGEQGESIHQRSSSNLNGDEISLFSSMEIVNTPRRGDGSGAGGKEEVILTNNHLNELENELLNFIKKYRIILNLLIRSNPKLLLGTMSCMVKYPSLLDFDVKRSYFRSKLHDHASGERYRYGGGGLNVRRDRLFEDSFHQLKSKSPEELRGRLTVQFVGEPGIDAGGLLKDWYQELSKQIFNPGYALFIQSADGSFQPNKDSQVNAQHLELFEFCGRIIGKAIYDGANMDVHFTRSFYKHILGKKVVWKDMEAVDPEYFKNLKWILDNDISTMDLTFSTDLNSFGAIKVIDLIPDGSNIPVTEENKKEYVQLLSQFKMTATIESQIKAFLKGFYELIPVDLISLFNELELELLISGLPDIDVEDMRRNTEYTGYRVDSPVIQYFWNAVKKYSQEERALLLQFVTGSSKVPLDGFVALQGMGGPQKFRIVRIAGETDRLPTAHTWFVLFFFHIFRIGVLTTFCFLVSIN